MRKYVVLILVIFAFLGCSKKQEETVQIKETKQIEKQDKYTTKSGVIQKGESLANSLLEFGIQNAEVYAMVNKLDEIFKLRYSQPADSFYVKLDSSMVAHELGYTRDAIKTYKVIMDSLGQYYTRVDTVQLTKEIKTCSGTIVSSLYKAMIDGGESGALPVLFTQIFQWDIDFFIDPQKGDQFKVVYEQYTNNGKFVRYGDILAAQYLSKNYDNVAYRFIDDQGTPKYYNDKGESFQKAFLKSPLNYKRITSYFGKRVHPVTKKVSMHNGVDYAAAYGTPVEAVADGTVIKASWHPNHTGNTVIIRHSNGYKTLYGHLSKYGKFKKGMHVSQHDIIGYVGSTGRSTGNHLHYTIYHHDKAINPMKLKNVSGDPVSQEKLEHFKSIVANLKTRINNIHFEEVEQQPTHTQTIIEEEIVEDEPLKDSLGMYKDESIEEMEKNVSVNLNGYLIGIIILLLIVIVLQGRKIKRLRY